MQTVTYYVLKNDKGEYITSDGDLVSIDECELAASWESADFARRSPMYAAGIRVVKVTRKIKPRTHSRAWAVKQVLKGKKVRTDRDESGCYIKLNPGPDRGFELYDAFNDYIDDACFMADSGYYLVP